MERVILSFRRVTLLAQGQGDEEMAEASTGRGSLFHHLARKVKMGRKKGGVWEKGATLAGAESLNNNVTWSC